MAAEHPHFDPAWPGRSHRRHGPEAQTLSPALAQSALYVCVAGLVGFTGLTLAGIEIPASWSWMEMLLPLLVMLATLAQPARRLPMQNIACIAGIILIFSSAIVFCGAKSGVPFGKFHFTEKALPKLSELLPLWIPLWWVAMLVLSRETARLILQPFRRHLPYGYWLIGVAAFLTAALDLGWEPFAVQVRQLWIWQVPAGVPTWYSTPWVNFVGWIAVAVVTLGFCSPWFMSKRPVLQPLFIQPALLWALLQLYFLAGNAAKGLWPAVAVQAILIASVLVLSWRGIHAPPPEPPPEDDSEDHPSTQPG